MSLWTKLFGKPGPVVGKLGPVVVPSDYAEEQAGGDLGAIEDVRAGKNLSNKLVNAGNLEMAIRVASVVLQ